MTMVKVKEAYLGLMFNTGKEEWVPRFVFQDGQEARNWQLKDADLRQVRRVGLVTDEEV